MAADPSADRPDLSGLIHDVPDFPSPGITFKDITPLLADAAAIAAAIEQLSQPWLGQQITKVVGIEARGFMLAVPVALRLGAGFVPLRKVGKLPRATVTQTYELEYGTDALEVHADAFTPTDRVLVIDDVLATGGTAAASVDLVTAAGGTVAGLGFLIELAFLQGASRLPDLPRTVLHTF